jgi:membrane-associated phospholipid phosphatase
MRANFMKTSSSVASGSRAARHASGRMRSLLIVTLVLRATLARADDVPAPAAPPSVPAPTQVSQPAPKPAADARDVAKKAALTPIIPNPRDRTRPAFQLYAEIDGPLVAVGAVFALARFSRTQPAFCAPSCVQEPLNALDNLTAGYYSAGWSRASDLILVGLGAGAAGLLVADEGILSALNDGAVVAEATVSATAVASVMTLAAGRPRPFLYGDKAPLSVRNSSDGGLSFISSHTAQAFAIVTSLYVAERRLHPRSRRALAVLGIGLPVASAIGVARVMAGYHFITDTIGGAIVGSSVGILVASVHGSPVHVVPVVSETQAGLGFSGRF